MKFFFFFLIFSYTYSQEKISSFKIFISQDSVYSIPENYFVENIYLDSVLLLENKTHYEINYTENELILYKSKTTLKENSFLILSLKKIPFGLRKNYFKRKLIESENRDEKKRTISIESNLSDENIFGDKSQITTQGMLMRGFTVGTNYDFSLQSGFNLQMKGNLTDKIFLNANLSDETSPLQPEGNTQALSEIDKIFIEILHPNFNSVFGDFDFTIKNFRFGNFSKKLKGGSLSFYSKSFLDTTSISYAVMRGNFFTNEFLGVDGVQGPYKLFGKNENKNIIVIAGSEKIYLNGRQLIRGNDRDFIIDYGSGEIFFTSKILVTNNMRIVVDFEYMERNFSKFFFTLSSSVIFFDNINTKVFFASENDDESFISLNERDNKILSNAGDSFWNATKSGVTKDTNGNYILQIENNDTIYVYNHDTLGEKYFVTFSFVGDGNGNYIKKSIGVFEYVGKQKGNYLPIIFLPIAEKKNFIALNLNTNYSHVNLFGEIAISNYDKNKFSQKDDNDNLGNAYEIGLNLNFEKFKANIRQTTIQKKFNSIDRIKEVEFSKIWNASSEQMDENFFLTNIKFLPNKFLFFEIDGGILNRKTIVSKRGKFNSNLYLENIFFMYNGEIIKRDSQNFYSNWSKQIGNVEAKYGKTISIFTFSNETRKDFFQSQIDTLASFRYNEIAPKFTVKNFFGMEFNSELKMRFDDSIKNSAFENVSRNLIQTYSLNIFNWKNFSSSFDFISYKKSFSKKVLSKNFTTNFFRTTQKINFWDSQTFWFYEITNEKVSTLEKIFVQVRKGTGTYVYKGDRNENGILDESDFELSRFDGDYILTTISGDNFVPITNLKTNLLLKINFQKFFENVSSETQFRIEEKNTSQNKNEIYFLHLNKFLSSNTQFGTQNFTQDILYDKIEKNFYLRFRFQEKKSLVSYSSGREYFYKREKSIFLKTQIDEEISNQSEVLILNDNLSTKENVERNWKIDGNIFTTDFSYHPKQRFIFGLKLEFQKMKNNFSSQIEANINVQSPYFSYYFEQRGEFKFELNREEVNLNSNNLEIPFQLTNGKSFGIAWNLKFNLNYKINSFTQIYFNYNGRKEKNEFYHLGKIEIKATF